VSDDYLWDRSGPVDPEVARLEQLLSPLRHDQPLDELGMRRRRRAPWIVLGVALAAAAALTIYLALPGDETREAACRGGQGFAFVGVGGAVTCDDSRVASGVLPVGGQLDTGAHEAEVTIADIGSAKLGKQTRVRLDRSDPQRHQLSLERGHMHAKVVAPPRLFAVATKHTDVIDLGCEYTIDIDERGAGKICVHTGVVELATKAGATVITPEGTCAAILAGQRPGLPHQRDARPEVIAEIRSYDAGEPAAFERLLGVVDRRDAITLVALAAIDARRVAVLERLMELSPPPDAEISVESAATNPEHMRIWQQDVLEIHYGLWGPRAGTKLP
jgi:hypothetical protein